MANEQAPVRDAQYLAVGDKMRLARLRRGWTQRDVARVCGEMGSPVDYGNIARWERGEFRPAPRNLLAIVRALELDIDELLAEYDALAAVVPA